ncbi:hypothetical protein HYV87_04985 [Candidatus Woesearchaeota archaeon]|nr:hypothetical protein [Candidatus Woesearchaeota archaeon]
MLDTIVTNLVARYNVRKIAPKGRLRDSFGEDKPTLVNLGRVHGKTHSGYILHFQYDNWGLIRYAGNPRTLFQKEQEGYGEGIFLVAVDMEQARAIAKMRMENTDFKEERIVDLICASTMAPQANRRLYNTMQTYNDLYGFNLDHDGFTIGNFLDDDTLL